MLWSARWSPSPAPAPYHAYRHAYRLGGPCHDPGASPGGQCDLSAAGCPRAHGDRSAGAHISVLVIAEWGRQSSDLLATLGFPNVATPPDDPAPALLRKPDARILAAIRHLAFDRRQEYRQSRSRDRWEGTATPTPGGRGGRCGARPVRWGIEHRSHRARNVTLGEEASLIHLGQGPAVFTVLRSAALSLPRPSGCHRITSRLRYHSQHPEEALALLLDTALARAWALDSMPRWSSSC